MNVRSSILTSLAAIFCFLTLAGCDNLTRERYEMITLNVDKEFDVAKMIGDPNHKLPGEWHYDRPRKHLNVVIGFTDDGTVTRKQWIDTANQNWEDTQEDPADESTYESTTIRQSNQ